jgi:hypothetical protein
MRSIYPLAAFFLTIVLVSPSFPARAAVLSAEVSISSNEKFVAPGVSIAGKVRTPEGRAIKGAYIVIRDANTNAVVRTTYSSTFGFYRLEQIETGKSYVLSITHRRYLFATAAQVIDINEERSGVDFIGEPSDE